MSTNPNTTTSTVTEEIAALMGRRGRISAVQLAKQLGWSYSYLSRRLNGHTDWTVGDLDTLAGFFNVAVTELFGHREGEFRTGSLCTSPDDMDAMLADFLASCTRMYGSV